MTDPHEGDVYRHPSAGEEVIIDYVTDAEVYLRVTDGAGGLIRACRVPRTSWRAIREVHGLELTNREETMRGVQGGSKPRSEEIMSEEKKQEPPTVNAIDLGAELKRYEAKDPATQREERVADPTASAGDAPMYVPPNSVPVLQSLIAEAAALDRALREQLRGILASVEAERARNARLIDMLEEMRAWGEAKHAGLQHEIAHLRDQLRKVAEGNVLHASTNEWNCEDVTEADDDDDE